MVRGGRALPRHRPVQFAYSLLTRSQRISHENLRLRDPDWLRGAEAWFQRQAGGPEPPAAAHVRALHAARHAAQEPHRRLAHGPVQGRGRRARPTGTSSTTPSAPRAARASSTPRWPASPPRAASPPAAPAPTRRSTRANGRASSTSSMPRPTRGSASSSATPGRRARPSSPGTRTTARSRRQLADVSVSEVPWSPPHQTPEGDGPRRHGPRPRPVRRSRAMAERAASTWSSCTWRTATCSRPSSPRCPTAAPTNTAAASRTACATRSRSSAPCAPPGPTAKPMSVRISATDWVGDAGVTPEEAVEIARCSTPPAPTSSTSRPARPRTEAKPVYGRMFQTPFSDRIRNEAGLATMAVGNINDPDQVNSILMAGRADLVCLARPHLADPYWTLHAASPLGDGAENGPSPTCPAATSSGAWPSAPTPCWQGPPMTLAGQRALVTGGGTGPGATSPAARAAPARGGDRRAQRRGARRGRPGAEMRFVTGDVTDPDEVARHVRRRERRPARPTSSSPTPAAPRAARSSRSPPTTSPHARPQPRRRLPDLAGGRCADAPPAGAASSPSPRPPASRASPTSPPTAPPSTASWASPARSRSRRAKTGVTVNALCPGFMLTPMTDRTVANIMAKTGRSRAEAEAPLLAANPQNRLIAPGRGHRRRALALRPTAPARSTARPSPSTGGET